MESYGGFEHNFQSLRIVEYLEYRYPTFRGLNLSVATREGILKHCSKKRAAALGSLGERFICGGQPSLEAQLANLADEIAYVTHDVDDGLRSGLLSVDSLQESELFAVHYQQISTEHKVIDGRRQIYEAVRRMIRELVNDLLDTSKLHLKTADINSLEMVRTSGEESIRFSLHQREKIDQLKTILNRELYQHYRVRRMSSKATQIIESLFSSFLNDVRLLPDDAQMEVRNSEAELGTEGRARAVTDYIAGMTDRYAITEYQRLFDPLQRT
jgi:dGTPase